MVLVKAALMKSTATRRQLIEDEDEKSSEDDAMTSIHSDSELDSESESEDDDADGTVAKDVEKLQAVLHTLVHYRSQFPAIVPHMILGLQNTGNNSILHKIHKN